MGWPFGMKLQSVVLAGLLLVGDAQSLHAQSVGKATTAPTAMKNPIEIMHGIRASFEKIRTIHYTFESNVSVFPVGKPSRNTPTNAEFAFENGHFYSSFHVDATSSQRGIMDERTAFDGLVYQRLNNKSSSLIIDSKLPSRPYSVVQPVMYQFVFAYNRNGRLTIEDISNQEVWDELTSHAILEHPEIVNGHPCDVVSFSTQRGTRELSWKLYAARDLGNYPVRASFVDRNVHTVSEVTEYKVVASPMGDVVVPVRITENSTDSTGRMTHSISFSVRLKSVNVDLDDSLFSLKRFDPERTKYVDSDPNLRRETERGGWLQVVLAINVGVVVLLLVAVLMRRMKWKAKAN